jgi:membrane protein implicated in regulation of membrane protease activity
MDWLGEIEAHWVWLTLGLLLGALEMLVPGVYLIWLALAAIITGVLTGLFDLSFPLQVVDFVSLSLIAVFSARRFLRERPIESPDPLLNHRAQRLVGEMALVTAPITHGSGRVKLGDSEWIARGADVAAGEYVRVTGSDGSMLLVEAMPQLPAEELRPE